MLALFDSYGTNSDASLFERFGRQKAHAAACRKRCLRGKCEFSTWNKTVPTGALSGEKAGRNLSAQLFQDFMCFLMVLGSRTCTLSAFAICCEYQTSDSFGRFLRNALYAFFQLAYLA